MAENSSPEDPYKGLAFIATTSGENALELYQQLHSVLKRKGIRAMAEGTVGVFGVMVRESDARAAVNAIAQAPELRGKPVKIQPKYLHLVQPR